MSNTITIELCAQDRARLDRLADALEKLTTHTPPREENPDPIQKAAAKALAGIDKATESHENAPEAAKEEAPATTPKAEEKPTQEKPAATPTARTVSRADVRSLVIQLSAKGKKAEARAVVEACGATKLPDIPEDKLAEVYDKLVALEG